MKRKANNNLIKFILPSLIVIIFITYIPLLYSFILSFFKGRGNDLTFAGLYNYKELINDNTFIITLKNSCIFTIIILPLIVLFCLYVSLQITKIKSEKLQNILITIFYVPCITSSVAYSLFFKQLCYNGGFISRILANMQIIPPETSVLQSIWGARIVIALICIWAWSGFYILLFITSIKSVNEDVYKAAKIDGISNYKVFTKIIIPSIKPTLVLISVIAATSIFQLYVESSIITKGGPQLSTFTLVNYLYKRAFTYVSQYGYSSTIGIAIFIICMIISILFIKKGK